MKRNLLAGFTGLIGLAGVGGYTYCGTPDCDDPGFLTVSVMEKKL